MTDRNDKGDEMSDRLSRRFGDDETTESANQSETSQTSKTDMNTKTEKSDSESIRDRPSVLMYLPDELHEELDMRFDELNLEYRREHGEKLQKNRDYYPAVIEAALSDRDLEEILLENNQ